VSRRAWAFRVVRPCTSEGKVPAMSDKDLTPHSEAWLAALERINPIQAAHTRKLIADAGTPDVCGICGDTPAHDCAVEGTVLRAHLCSDCERIQGAMR